LSSHSFQNRGLFSIQQHEVEREISRYFGVEKGGVDLRQALLDLPLQHIQLLARAIEDAKAAGGRVFFMGNGGSHDNARALAFMCREHGIDAKTPGREDDYAKVTLRSGYDAIFAGGLAADSLTAGDVVVGISGSGNSANVVSALVYAKEIGARAFCLGGRDGGAMRTVCTDDNSVIVKNDCMEAIEDLHLLAGALALRLIANPRTPDDALGSLVADFDSVVSSTTLSTFSDIALGVLGSIERQSHTLVLGVSIGSNHVMADWERGATNRLPIRGVSAPMMYSQNSAMATLNDDGFFSLAHGLVKKNPSQDDFAIVFDVLAPSREITAAEEVLIEAATPYIKVGGSGLSLEAFSEPERDIFPAMVGHCVSATLRELLSKKFQVKPRNDIQIELEPGDKKLGKRQTLALEQSLREDGRLPEGRVLVFNYGNLFEAAAPEQFGLQRAFY
jgi:D-sedoheptulose 7-phosphate isomerase